MATVHLKTGRDKYRTIINNGSHQIIADEPLASGGENLGFNPKELLASALGACTSITLRMYADRKEWNIDSIETEVSVDWNKEESKTYFTRKIAFTGELDDIQKERLLKIANSCPVHKILSGEINIETTVS